MSDSEAAWNNDSGFYIGQTPPQTKPIRSHRHERQLLRQRARLLRHEHALRDDHEVEVLQQRPRHRPERARQREVRAAGGQRHHRQRHLLEQLQLLRRARRSSCGRPRRTRRTPSASACCSSAAARTRVEGNRVYGNYLVGVGAIQQVLLKQTGRPDHRRQRRAEQHVRRGRRRPQRPRPVLRRQRQGQLLGPEHADVAHGARRTARSSSPCPFSGQNTFDSAGAGHGARAGRWTRRSRTGSSTPHAAKPGYTPLERYVKGQTPMEQPSK